MNQFEDYFKHGVIVQKDGDSGDSAQRCGTYISLSCIKHFAKTKKWEGFEFDVKDLSHFIELLSVKKGRYRRSPDPSHWGSDPTNFSRDQHSVLNLAMAARGSKKNLMESMLAIFKRFGFHQNFLRGTDDPYKEWKCPDIITPTQLSVFIRGMGYWWAYPVLLVLDIGFILDLWFRKKSPWDYDNMLAQNLFYASLKYPTLFSYLALLLYSKTDFMDRIKEYYCTGNGIPPLYYLYLDCYNEIKEHFSKRFKWLENITS